MRYIEVKGNFNEEFPTYVIGYCPDINSWFITKQRYWAFQFNEEFNCYDEALNFFNNNQEMILNKQNEILAKCFHNHTPTTEVHLAKELEGEPC